MRRRSDRLLLSRRVVVALLFTSVAVAACLPAEVVSDARTLVVEGRLQGRVLDGFPCLWIVESSGEHLYFGVPPGWDELADPPRVIDSDGAVVAKAGDMVRGEATVGLIGSGGETICAPGADVIALDTLVKL